MRSMKVLIIDDDGDSLDLAGKLLERDGHEVLTSPDGSAGIRKAASENPDLILLDVEMQGKNGYRICRQLKADTGLRNIPVIFLSSSNDPLEKVKGLDLGAVDYVTKPFDRFELPARVRAALRTKRLQDLLLEHSEIDSLTEIYNRRVLMDRLDQEWGRTRRYSTVMSFIMADIDDFKSVNDTHGHPKGDEVLERVAGVLKNSSRNGDIVGRYGGDEFAVLMINADLKSAALAGERYRRSIEELGFSSRKGAFRVTVSFGVADSRGKKTARQLVAAADEALYQAKDSGRNRVCTRK